MRKRIYASILLIFFIICMLFYLPLVKAKGATMNLSSPAFKHEGFIPQKYTCDGADVSPPVKWDSVPSGTKSFAIICDDIPKEAKDLPENVAPTEHPSNGGKQGTNDFRKIGYGGPCPPGGTHRYYFKLYALDTLLNIPPGATKNQLLEAMENHILDQTQFMGKYKR